MKIKLKPLTPRNFVAKDLRTPKYAMRVVVSKKSYKRVNEFKIMKENDYA
jgi:hypothetical protein